MTPRRRRGGFWIAAGLGAALPGLLAAQEQEAAPPADSAAADSAATDTLPAVDSVALRVHAARATLPPQTPPGPLPVGTRIVFEADSLRWFEGYTLADLLGTLPGAYVVRTGFLHQPHPVTWGGRSADAIEIHWDGTPLLPLGPDSVHVDPGRISLFGLERVEVRRDPGRLRVYLVSARHREPQARSVIRIASGDVETTGYAALFQHKWNNGFAVNLRGDFLATEGVRELPRDDNFFDLWARVDWVPSPTVAASWQIRSNRYERTGIEGEAPGFTTARDGRRQDVLFRFTAAQREHHRGLTFDAGFANSRWTDTLDTDSLEADSLDLERTARQVFLGVGWRGDAATVELMGRTADAHYDRGLEARWGWGPFSWLTVSGEGSTYAYPGGRTTRRGQAALGLHGGPFHLTGEAATGDLLPAPLLLEDTVQSTTDLGVQGGIRFRRFGASGGVTRRAAYLPRAPAGLPAVSALRTSLEATWYTAEVRLQPFRELTLDAVYSTPSGLPADFQPPQHGRAAVTFRSNAWSLFPSGAFDLKIRYGLEFWSTWVAGVDADGVELEIPGATFHDLFIQFRIVGFHGFYRLQNARNSVGRYAPGLDWPRNLQTFGVTWEFAG